ncbi:bactofilin family protein [Clostridium aminobutyricum]|uniref:Polymer-forming cytoskeletal protein n=1 Tax=Clostridium aminobutyricum TaxID=33953 RepID=A0A939DA76_CLOAM|nr:polymer-forming cytoskeletal protein [Clostridium aminobutyricum]MBN7774006.1 polymer-forming cytoskeletal protein [Clostridium aminobutyricum]
MSNKGNFSQAMREILGIDSSHDEAKEGVEATAGKAQEESHIEEQVNTGRLNQDFNQSFNESSRAYGAEEKKVNPDNSSRERNEEPAFFDRPEYGQKSNNTFSGNYAADSNKFNNAFNGGNGNGPGNPNDRYGDEGEVGTTIITRNTIVEGNIKSFENIELNGKVKGTIDTTKNVGVSGFVQGDIIATDILLEGAQIKGNISSKGALLMDKDTLLVGDVEAQNTRVDGKIKGEVNIGGNGEFLSNSVVVGNITVSNFYVQYGARMQGYINTNFSKSEEENIFGQITSN